jgi:L-seryl-tRNA(Ser) seleniumtransferase
MAVNNNAAAVMLVLSSMAKGGEVVVSRGELVEIGGTFRIPDVMAQSGATLVEVGTTNKTHLSDYRDAVTENTKALMKVHTSNYRIVGFSETVPVNDLRPVADEAGLPIIEDLGSGVLVDLSQYGLSYEPTVQDSLKAGADVVCFSGDKLLGGPQAGVIVGKKKYIDLMKKNQLTRALRIDKFTAAALELTLLEYLDEEKAVQNIPVLKMIRETEASVKERALKLKEMLENAEVAAEIGIESCDSQIGGGSLPLERLSGYAVTIKPDDMSDMELERRLRRLEYPVIARIGNDRISLAVRTIETVWFEMIVKMMKEIFL